MATTTVILVAGGVTALAVRDPGRDAASTPTAAMPAPPTPVPKSAPSTPALPATTAPNTATTTTPPASARPTTSAPTNVITREAAEPAPAELVELADAIAGRARSIDGFGAVVHQVQDHPGQPASEITRSVVFRSDGVMWASDESGGWASHNPSTGTARTAFPMPPDGPLAYHVARRRARRPRDVSPRVRRLRRVRTRQQLEHRGRSQRYAVHRASRRAARDVALAGWVHTSFRCVGS